MHPFYGHLDKQKTIVHAFLTVFHCDAGHVASMKGSGWGSSEDVRQRRKPCRNKNNYTSIIMLSSLLWAEARVPAGGPLRRPGG
jgi:hypothetical protein